MPIFTLAQGNKADSFRQIIRQAMHDSVRISACWDLYDHYEESNRDSARYYIEEGLRLSRKHGKKLAEARCLVSLAYQQLSSGGYAESFGNLLQAFSLAENQGKEKDNWLSNWSGAPSNSQPLVLAYAHHTFANLMTPTRNTKQQVFHYREALRLGKQVGNAQRILLANLGLGRTYLDNNWIDSSLIFEKEAARIAQDPVLKRFLPAIQSYLGALYFEKNEPTLALQNLYYGIQTANEYGNPTGRLAQNYYRLTKYYLAERNKDSSLYYALKFKQAMEIVGSVSLSTVDKGMAYEYLSLAYKLNNQHDSAVSYQGLALTTKDSINNARINSLAEFQNLNLQEQLRLRNLEKEQELYQSRVRSYGLLAGLLVFSVIAIILYRNNKQKQKTNRELENTLSNLKSTQAQLIQSEKMASLGELTAGIAHEIQNPLNFVNNFSEVNKDLLEEVKNQKSEIKNEELDDLLDDILQNNEKILHHGKRADAIVKGMLQHSQKGSGVKEPTNINALADEYLRLAYHGLKAKDNTFNATIKTDFDPSIGNINIIPQDIGRVLLNLINNAFYAVDEKKKQIGAGYEPEVTVSTRMNNASKNQPISQLANSLIISVRDNGNGIPQKILDKIFQPFFTTKPTGQGTGLGLSLSYDIVKAHGGELTVETKEGKSSEFVIMLPLN
ncbi:MAG TPA: ATP-binding protein [Chitinophagaceae bacterium]|nr:ATP-binding protein [Chitinophagaceae bacterium]